MILEKEAKIEEQKDEIIKLKGKIKRLTWWTSILAILFILMLLGVCLFIFFKIKR